MNRTTIARTIFISAFMLSASAHAGNDIVKCVDRAGRITLTDEACPDNAQVVSVLATASSAGAIINSAVAISADGAYSPATAPRATRIERYTLARLPVVRHDMPLKRTPIAAGLNRDVMTLKAARLTMRMLDTTAQAARSQRIAGLQ